MSGVSRCFHRRRNDRVRNAQLVLQTKSERLVALSGGDDIQLTFIWGWDNKPQSRFLVAAVKPRFQLLVFSDVTSLFVVLFYSKWSQYLTWSLRGRLINTGWDTCLFSLLLSRDALIHMVPQQWRGTIRSSAQDGRKNCLFCVYFLLRNDTMILMTRNVDYLNVSILFFFKVPFLFLS